MNTIAWLLIIASVLIVRGVSKGRVMELPGDFRDMMLGALTSDFAAVREAAGRTGEGLTPALADEGSAVATGTAGVATGVAGAGSSKGLALLAEMRRLGSGRPYIWGGTFANGRGGDCSGLVWRAMRNRGYYSGARFTTFTWPAATRSIVTVVTDPKPGDVCVWQRGGVSGHMGIVVGPDRTYGALSRRSGIKETSIKGISGRLTYYRLK